MSPEFTTGIVVAFVLVAVAFIVLFCLYLDTRGMIRNVADNVRDYNLANYQDKQDWRNGQSDQNAKIEALRLEFEAAKERINQNFALTGERLGDHRARFKDTEDRCSKLIERLSGQVGEIAAGQRHLQTCAGLTEERFGSRVRALEDEDNRKSEILRELGERLTEEEDYSADLREEFESFREEALTAETLDSALLGDGASRTAALNAF